MVAVVPMLLSLAFSWDVCLCTCTWGWKARKQGTSCRELGRICPKWILLKAGKTISFSSWFMSLFYGFCAIDHFRTQYSNTYCLFTPRNSTWYTQVDDGSLDCLGLSEHIVQSRILVMSDYSPFAKVQRIIKNQKENWMFLTAKKGGWKRPWLWITVFINSEPFADCHLSKGNQSWYSISSSDLIPLSAGTSGSVASLSCKTRMSDRTPYFDQQSLTSLVGEVVDSACFWREADAHMEGQRNLSPWPAYTSCNCPWFSLYRQLIFYFSWH